MRKHLLFIWTVLLGLGNNYCYATHVFGGELLYTHLTGNSYKVTLTLYGDCSAQNISILPIAEPKINIYNDKQFEHTLVLDLEANSGVEVSPVCPGQLSNTACNGGILPGVRQFIYSNTVAISTLSSKWRFEFAGDLSSPGSQQIAGRSGNITNIGNPGSSDIYLEAILNNLQGPNSSPQYSTIPTPFYCIYTQQQYNPGAIDPDNDSLGFSLVPGLLDNVTQVAYIPPYSASAPLAVSNFSFNTINGQLGFMANQAQNSLVVNKVEEYKNGILVGSSMREMTFVVFSTCSNRPPVGNLEGSTMAGGIYAGNNIINVCQGTPFIKFSIPAIDSDADNITVTPNNIPPGATVNITNNNTPNATINFSWNTTNITPGIYNMYINYRDNGCPLSSNQTVAYTIKVIGLNQVNYTSMHPTDCYHRQWVQLSLTQGTVPRTVTVTRGKFTKTYTDSTGIILDSFYKGDYHIHISSANFPCTTDYDFSVVDSGVFYPPVLPEIHSCLYDVPKPILVPSVTNATIKWYTTEGQSFQGPPNYTTGQPATFQWYVTQQFSVCESEKKLFTVNVYDLPNTQIQTEGGKVCLGDEIDLVATGGIEYEWFPKDSVFVDWNTMTMKAKVMAPITYSVIATDTNGCKKADSIIYADIEQCCTFSYPGAFTPNGDGKNDGFRILLYGNEHNYYFSIFNRWGERVFHTEDPKQYWDGTSKGRMCDVGTYFYYVKGTCLTGHVEEQKGELQLIR